jgi:hypothetical protein
MITFDEVMAMWSWKPIHGCPGRYILNATAADLLPEDLLGPDVEMSTFQVPAARDTVVVVRLDGGGLISYRRSDEVYLHTLNNTEGFERKLSALGIEFNSSK